jgi:hypothetical protein
MPGKIPEEFQNLHFDTLTLSPTWVNWVEKWLKAQESSLIGPTMWTSSIRDGKTHLGAYALVFKKV